MTRKHIVFYGWVQGVGFRYRARHAADLYGCTGWVRNEYDGSVSMEIQGEEENIDKVMPAEIASDPAGSFLFVNFFRSHPSILLRT